MPLLRGIRALISLGFTSRLHKRSLKPPRSSPEQLHRLPPTLTDRARSAFLSTKTMWIEATVLRATLRESIFKSALSSSTITRFKCEICNSFLNRISLLQFPNKSQICCSYVNDILHAMFSIIAISFDEFKRHFPSVEGLYNRKPLVIASHAINRHRFHPRVGRRAAASSRTTIFKPKTLL